MYKEYKSYDIVNSLSQQVLDNLELDSTLETFKTPFFVEKNELEEELVNFIDVAFINTKAFSETGAYYQKHGKYTKLHSVFNKKEYDEFWDEEERRRKEGISRPCRLVKKDDGTYVLQNLHITGEHYGYLNYAPIMRITDEALNAVGELLKSGVDPKDERVQAIVDKKEEGFPAFLDSDYYYFKAVELARRRGEHLVVAKARRKGYSYKNGWLAANLADLNRNIGVGLAAFHADSLYPEGTMSMSDNYLQHIAKTTDWAKRRSIDKKDHIKFGYFLNDGLGIEYGFKSSIVAKSFAPNNAGAIRGKDRLFIMLEESGKNPILAQVLTATLPSLKAGIFTTGLMIVFGTGGGENKQWEDFEDLFYAPSVQGFMSFNNIWDEDGIDTEAGFFVPSFMGKEGFFDVHGNSDVRGAVQFEDRERAKRKKSRVATTLSDYMMEEPYCPKEAFSRSNNNIFPSVELEQQLRRVLRDPEIAALTRHGNLVTNDKGKIIFKDTIFMDEEELKHFHPPVLNFPLKKGDDPHGCVTIYKHPHRDKNNNIPDNLYRIRHDPYALPKNEEDITGRDSLGVTHVYEVTNNFTPGFGDRIVAEFVGRPETTDEYNDIMFKLAMYYNAVIQFENDRGDVFNYAKRHKLLHMLADEPESLAKKEHVNNKSARKKGISIQGGRKESGVIYSKDWLLVKRGTQNSDEQIATKENQSLNLHYIYSQRLLRELLKFNMKGNFDSVSTLIVGMFDDREMLFQEIVPQQSKPMTPNNVFNRPLF